MTFRYPEPEVISNSICTLFNNFGGVCFLFALPPLLNSKLLNIICLGAGALCLLIFALFDCGLGPSEVYKRRDAEAALSHKGF